MRSATLSRSSTSGRIHLPHKCLGSEIHAFTTRLKIGELGFSDTSVLRNGLRERVQSILKAMGVCMNVLCRDSMKDQSIYKSPYSGRSLLRVLWGTHWNS